MLFSLSPLLGYLAAGIGFLLLFFYLPHWLGHQLFEQEGIGVGQMVPPAASALLLERLPGHRFCFEQVEKETGLATFLKSREYLLFWFSFSPVSSTASGLLVAGRIRSRFLGVFKGFRFFCHFCFCCQLCAFLSIPFLPWESSTG